MEYELVLDEFGEGGEVFNLAQPHLQERLQRVIVARDGVLQQVVDGGIDLGEVLVVGPRNFRGLNVLHGRHGGAAFALVHHADLAEMATLLNNARCLRLEPVAKLILHSDLAGSFCDEVHGVVLWFLLRICVLLA